MSLENPPRAEAKTAVSPANLLALVASIAAFLVVPGIALGACQVGAVSPSCTSMQWSASLISVLDDTGLMGSVAPTLTGTLTFDTSVPDTDPDPQLGYYAESVECGFADLGARTSQLELVDSPVDGSFVSVANEIDESNGQATVFGDLVSVGFTGNGNLGATVGIGSIVFAYNEFCTTVTGDCPVTLLANDDFPPAPGAVENSLEFSVTFFSSAGDSAQATAVLDQLSSIPVVPCPEPGMAVGLAVAGLAMVSGMPRGRTRSDASTTHPACGRSGRRGRREGWRRR